MARWAELLLAGFLLAACTGSSRGPAGGGGLEVSGSPSMPASQPPSAAPSLSPSPEGVVLHVVADVTPGGDPQKPHQMYLDGMRLAAEEANSAGGVGGRQVELAIHPNLGRVEESTRIIDELLSEAVPAVLYAGPGTALPPLRPRFGEVGTPVVLLEGDLYSTREMFPQVFQTTIPWVWQANAIARYVVTDRRAETVVFGGHGPEAQAGADTMDRALRYWGGELDHAFTTCPCVEGLERAAAADWVVLFGPPPVPLELANAIEEIAPLDDPGITGNAGLLAIDERLAHPEPGTSAPYTYTWAGWAEPVPRVISFVERFQAVIHRPPTGLEQEGFDAVRATVEALRANGGRGGADLVQALEDMEERTFSSFPVDFGPDDHLFLPRAEVGLFAIPGPRRRLDPWQSRAGGEALWRPIMRTFTNNGERTNILDRDRPNFFPFWDEDQPAPDYWRSRYGIVTGPDDPLH